MYADDITLLLLLLMTCPCCSSGAVLRRGVRVLPGPGSDRSSQGLLQRAVAVRGQACSQQEVQVQGGGGGGTVDREDAAVFLVTNCQKKNLYWIQTL